MRRGALLTTPRGLTLPAIGSAFMGGYYAGIIDTTRPGSIVAADTSQTGLRYALIVAPKSLEATLLQWATSDAFGPGASRTRWNGLAATTAMASTTYPAANYCYGLTFPTDAASRWYLPAMDELELVYRNLKGTTEPNPSSASQSSTVTNSFPFSGVNFSHGANVSSDPTGAAYESASPARTTVAVFQDGGGQDLGDAGTNLFYWTATEYDASSAWIHGFSGSAFSGFQSQSTKTTSHVTRIVRPVRRLVL